MGGGAAGTESKESQGKGKKLQPHKRAERHTRTNTHTKHNTHTHTQLELVFPKRLHDRDAMGEGKGEEHFMTWVGGKKKKKERKSKGQERK